MPGRLPATTLALLLAFPISIANATAQVPERPRAPADPAPSAGPARVDFRPAQDAGETREELHRILGQYSPALREVFRHDPSLMTNQDYLKPYPRLAAFLAEHPEVTHNPSYFVGSSDSDDPRDRAYRTWERTFETVAIVTVVITIASAILWLIRMLMEHYRWNKLAKAHVDLQSRLLDRFSSNPELLTYLETPAGRRLLEAAPTNVDVTHRSPLSRILWSVQAGLVLSLAGAALLFVSGRVLEMGQPFFVLGVLGVAIGAGFILSAGASYLLSRRLGLLETTRATAGGE
jgi:hypothetical protein